ncbi:MAG TPA: AraC family transcriptional regulator [Pseudolysinimonas sp.]|nr:AraC family transcriptional regulator [Pseudolysinimonas sp.]
MTTAETVHEWQELASRSFVPLECHTPAAEFRGSLDSVTLAAGVSISDISSDGAVITRTPRLAARAGSDDLHLTLHLNSSGLIHNSAKSVAVGPGSVSVYATDKPYQLDYSAPQQHMIVVQMSRSELELPRATIESAATSMAMTHTPARTVFVSFVRTLVSTFDTLDEHMRQDYSRVLSELAGTMLRSSETGRRLVPGSSESLLYTIQEFVRDHAHSAELTPDDIAQAHFISRRKLYDLFAHIDTTPAAYIRDERLRNAAQLLTDAPGRLPVSEIAVVCGFGDVTTFTRAFRKQFGMTPRDWRSNAILA